MAAPGHLAQHIGMFQRHLPDDEERRLDAEAVEDVEDNGGAMRMRAVVEGEQHLFLGQRLDVRELQRAQMRGGGGIDHQLAPGQGQLGRAVRGRRASRT
jgi:hypothetical protein